MGDFINNMKSICENNNCRLYCLYAPGQLEVSLPGDISYYPFNVDLNDTTKFDLLLARKSLKQLCIEKNVMLIDPTEILKKNQIQPVYFSKSWHWNKEGHMAIAIILSGELQSYIKLQN